MRYIKKFWLVVIALMTISVWLLPLSAAAVGTLTARSVTLSSSSAAASNATTTYSFGFTTATTATFQSFQAQACTTASGTCTTPTGFSIASSTLTSTTLSGTWAVNTGTAGSLRAAASSGATSTTSGTAKSIVFGNVQNPTTTNQTFFLRMTLYSDTAWTTAVDSGNAATSTANQITVTASVDETLTFCTGTSGITSSSCSGATGSSLSLGSVSTSTTGSGTSQIGVTTNAGSGYSITVSGNTLTSGSNTITALSTQTASTQGTSQFGLNLKANTTPSVGSDPAGAGTANPTANYNTADQYRFVSGDAVASKGTQDDFRLFTVSYIANIGNTTAQGNYTTTLTYICTATF